MKTATNIPKSIQQDLITMTKDLLQAQPPWAAGLPMSPQEPYMTLKQFETLLCFCNRDRERRSVYEYVRYPLMTMDHPLFSLFHIEDEVWYVMLAGMRGGHTGHTYAIPVRYLRSHVQCIVTRKNLSQPYAPPARLIIQHYVQHSLHRHHSNYHLLMENLKKQFPQYSRQTIWRAVKSFPHSPFSKEAERESAHLVTNG